VSALPHSERFSGRVQAYAAHRPRFPQGILRFLRQQDALRKHAVVADIGAGTGMLAELFLDAGHRVLAVEPNDEMLTACRELAASCTVLEVVKGSAEATTLPDASVDLITVGRAMHWFDWPQAHREFARILRPAGWVLIATNGHREGGAPVSDLLASMFRRWRSDLAGRQRQPDFNERLQGFLDTSTWQRERLEDAIALNFESLLGYAESLSAMPRSGEAGYEEMVAEIREVFEHFQQGGVLLMPCSCELFLGRLRSEYVEEPPALT
jgi:ubiquinone/menaquinone biosynthesis C-methylase UbiE